MRYEGPENTPTPQFWFGPDEPFAAVEGDIWISDPDAHIYIYRNGNWVHWNPGIQP